MASEHRNIDLSLHYRVAVVFRQLGYFSPAVNAPASALTGTPLLYAITDPLQREFPFCYLDEAGLVSDNGLSVSVGGLVQDPSSYQPDYRGGTIAFSSAPGGDVTITALVQAFKVKEAYVDDEELAVASLPLMSIVTDKVLPRPFAIGTSLKFRDRSAVIDLFALNKGQQQDTMDDLVRWLAKTDYIDFTAAEPLLQDGRLNPAFDPSAQFRNNLPVRSIQGILLKKRRGGTDKEDYRAMVMLDFESVS